MAAYAASQNHDRGASLFQSISIKGYRSFDDERGIELLDLGAMNLIVGPNNVGKSNVGRFLGFVRRLAGGIAGWPNNAFNPRNANQSARQYFLQGMFDARDRWRFDEDVCIEARLTFRESAQLVQACAPDLVRDAAVVATIRTARDKEQRWYAEFAPDAAVTSDERWIRRKLKKHEPAPLTDDQRETALDGAWTSMATLAAGLRPTIVEIHAVRDTRRPAVQPRENDAKTPKDLTEINGSDVPRVWRAFLNDTERRKARAEAERSLDEWVALLLGEPNVEVRLDGENRDFEVTLSNGLTFALSDLGTGVAEMVILFASLLCFDRRIERVVVLEEPEAHLHPGAVVELVRLLRERFPGMQFFIISHSPSIVDAVAADWRVFRLSRDPATAATRVQPIDIDGKVDGALGRFEMLAALGVRPSQLFLVNAAVFVEGPSDVHYLRRLLRGSGLVEGRDFGFLTYCGAAGSHLGLGEGAVVDMLRLNPHPIIVCDEDDGIESSPGRKWVRALKAASIAARVGRVITTGAPGRPVREIENLVAATALRKAASEEIKYIVRDGVRVLIEFDEFEMDDQAQFKTVLADAARTADGPISADEHARIEERLDKAKVTLALLVGSMDDQPFTTAGLALRNRLVGAIRGDS